MSRALYNLQHSLFQIGRGRGFLAGTERTRARGAEAAADRSLFARTKAEAAVYAAGWREGVAAAREARCGANLRLWQEQALAGRLVG
jgi:hypothetical protein